MTKHSEKIYNKETYTVGIANTLIGLVAYMFLVVPILTLTIVGLMNLEEHYGMALAASFVITGLYVTEKATCTDS